MIKSNYMTLDIIFGLYVCERVNWIKVLLRGGKRVTWSKCPKATGLRPRPVNALSSSHASFPL